MGQVKRVEKVMENLRAHTAALKSRKEAVHIAEKVGLCTVD